MLAMLTACSPTSPDVVPGVSLELATHRKATISDITYRLHFDIPAEPDAPIDADLEIRFSLADASLPLQLDFREREDRLQEVGVNGAVSEWRFENEHLVIPAGELVTGENRIAIRFTAGDTSLNRNPGYLYTLFVPDRARTVFPLFDQPDLKAVYELTLVVPRGWLAMSNALAGRVHFGAETTEYRFQPSEPISSYLFSFVAGEFESVTRRVDGRTMTMLHRETDDDKVARNVEEIFSLHAAAIDWLEAYTGIAYPFSKFGFALIPAFQYGGMEHVGAIQYRASSLFLDEAPSDTELLDRAGLIAHETAHMWFGDLVTMEWFDDVWTKEVFANFMAAKIVNPGFPDVNHDLNFLVRHYPRAYSVDRTDGANPIRQFLPNLNEAGQMYGAIIYNKAPIMMRQLEVLMGEDQFRDSLREYLDTYAFDNATWPGLVAILDSKSDEDVAAWSETWVNTPGRSAIQARWERGDDIVEPAFRYGLVPADAAQLDNWANLDEVSKAALLINSYEGLIAGRGIAPLDYFRYLVAIAEAEPNQLVLDLALDQLRSVFWLFLPEAVRPTEAPLVERVLWEAMLVAKDASIRKTYFQAFADIAVTPGAVEDAYNVWAGSADVDDLPLAENDLIALAQALAIKLPDRSERIVGEQLARTENPDNMRKLEFVAPSLSPDAATRDQFFASLAEAANRQTEPWVLDALANLHHPLRIRHSETYILPSLELLQEIQVTGDIFFPKRWLDETLANHRSASAAAVVRSFLDERPGYNEQLRMKILQSAHMLFRASDLQAAAAGRTRQ